MQLAVPALGASPVAVDQDRLVLAAVLSDVAGHQLPSFFPEPIRPIFRAVTKR